ncbi:MAG TPA: trypsin-like peptidase domain-containing protein [Actinomycetota bacterium]|nr:trypsin-like peptidase domain-containing protein [Actinomycetota bacterium]
MANHDDEFEREPEPKPAGSETDPAAEAPTDPNMGRGETGGFHAAGWTDERSQAAIRHPSVTARGTGQDDARPAEPGRGDSRVDDWFWWTDGEQQRPVHQVPPRPDVQPQPQVVWGPPPTTSLPPLAPPRYAQGDPRYAQGDPWSAREEWSSGPRHAARKGRGGAIVAAMLASAVLIASGVGIGWGLSQSNGGSSNAANPPVVTGPGVTNPNGGGSFGNPNGGSLGNGGTDNGNTGNGSTGDGSSSTNQVVNTVLPSLVVIKTELGSGAPGQGAIGAAAGTGMILTSDGQVLTNNHVIRGSTSIEVTTSDGHTYNATVVGADPADDVAMLQLDGASGLPTIKTDTSDVSKGTSVIAIGNAYGQGTPSATTGSVTDVEQSITAGDPGSPPERLHGLIQTNAPIAPGDSGGALVDTQGEVLGMITAATQTSAFSKTSTEGYAITIGDALNIIGQIRSGSQTGDIVYGRPGLMGVQLRNLSAAAASRLGLSTNGGAYVIQVVPNTPASNAGMTDGSVITAIDGHSITSAADVSDVMHQTKPGQSISVTWVDTSGPHTASMELITAPAV